jgi:mRNA interferase MazF
MLRGEIWTSASAADYGGKPRPVVILQSDRYETDSVTVCPFTTDPAAAPLARLAVEPSAENGLRLNSRIMVDKITTVPRKKIGARIGRLADSEILQLDRAVLLFLGLAD